MLAALQQLQRVRGTMAKKSEPAAAPRSVVLVIFIRGKTDWMPDQPGASVPSLEKGMTKKKEISAGPTIRGDSGKKK